MSSNGESDPSSEVIAALTKQLGVDAAAVERAFRAGVSHAETMAKRRRVGENLSEASRSKGAEEETSGIKFSEGISFEQLRQELAEFAKERDWDSCSDVGELCECFQWKGEVEEGLPGWSDKHRTAVRQEIADVLLYLIRLSHKCHIDLPKAALDKLAVNVPISAETGLVGGGHLIDTEAAKYPAGLEWNLSAMNAFSPKHMKFFNHSRSNKRSLVIDPFETTPN
eukprot:g19818.t1